MWRQERQELAKIVPTAGNDVFDPMNYGEDEFGPEDQSVCPPKKKQRCTTAASSSGGPAPTFDLEAHFRRIDECGLPRPPAPP